MLHFIQMKRELLVSRSYQLEFMDVSAINVAVHTPW